MSVTDSDKESYLNQANALRVEIQSWVGTDEREMIGLGQNCNASWYVKETENKKASYPFDWIFTTPELVLDMLGDDFEALLDRKRLIPHGLDAGHERYHEWLFGHRNPASSESDFAFMQRCVDRWNVIIKTQRPILFVTVVLNEFEKRKRWRIGFSKEFKLPKNQTLSDFVSMMEKIQSISPNCKFLFIEQYTDEPFELSVTEKNDQAFWLKFSSIASNTGVKYVHDLDDEVMKTIMNSLQT